MLEYNLHQLSRVSPEAEKKYIASLELAYSRAVTALNERGGLYTKARLQRIIIEINNELKSINQEFSKNIYNDIGEIIYASQQYTQKELEWSIKYPLAKEHFETAVALATINKEGINKLININRIAYYYVDAKGVTHTYSTTQDMLIKSIADSQAKKVKSTILGEYSIGSSVENIIKAVKPYISGDTAKRDIRTVVQSLIVEANSRATSELYRENEEYIDKYLFVAVLDSRTSSLCRSLDGHKFDAQKPHYTPPLHPNCRSDLVAIPKGYKQGERPIILKDGMVKIVNDKDFSFKDAAALYPELNNKKLIDVDKYIKSII